MGSTGDIEVRFSPEERDRLRAVAWARNIPMSQMVRDRMRPILFGPGPDRALAAWVEAGAPSREGERR
jgi:hypothetical protein